MKTLIFGLIAAPTMLWAHGALACDFDPNANTVQKLRQLPANSAVVIDTIFDPDSTNHRLEQDGQEVPVEVSILQQRSDDGRGVTILTPLEPLQVGSEITVLTTNSAQDARTLHVFTVEEAQNQSNPLGPVQLGLDVEVFATPQEDQDFCNGERGTLRYTLHHESETPVVLSLSAPTNGELPLMRVTEINNPSSFYVMLDPIDGQAPCLDIALFSPLTHETDNLQLCPNDVPLPSCTGEDCNETQTVGCAQAPSKPSGYLGILLLLLGFGLFRERQKRKVRGVQR